MTLHPQITRRHCSISSVSCLCWYERHKTALQSAHQLFLIHTGLGVLASCKAATVSSTVSVGWIHLYHVSKAFTYMSLLIEITADASSSSCPCCSVELDIVVTTLVSMSIYWNTQSMSGHTRILGTRVRQMQGKWYIHKYHYSVRRSHCHDQCGTCPNET